MLESSSGTCVNQSTSPVGQLVQGDLHHDSPSFLLTRRKDWIVTLGLLSWIVFLLVGLTDHSPRRLGHGDPPKQAARLERWQQQLEVQNL